jgi:hypothetical protein
LGIRYQCMPQGCLDNGVDRHCAGHLPGPDPGQSEEGSKGLDQEREYKGGDSIVSTTTIDTDSPRG